MRTALPDGPTTHSPTVVRPPIRAAMGPAQGRALPPPVPLPQTQPPDQVLRYPERGHSGVDEVDEPLGHYATNAGGTLGASVRLLEVVREDDGDADRVSIAPCRITKSPSGTVRLQAISRRAVITLDRRKRPAERLQRRLVAQVFGRPGLACRPARPRDSLCWRPRAVGGGFPAGPGGGGLLRGRAHHRGVRPGFRSPAAACG